nr:retrotransposon protein, putative, Ty1-copia subclass [Tanacetum cinerariifolium]
MFMGNGTSLKIEGKGKVILKMTSRKDKEQHISNTKKRVMNDQLSQDETDNNSEVPQENVELRRSKSAKVTKDFGPDYMMYIVNEEPQAYKATIESSEAPYWKEAIQNEEIYMQQPEGFIVKGQEHKVCKLVKSLFGLKQAPKQWHEKFDNTLLSNGFQINKSDKCVYVKQYKNAFVIICLYVDDMLIMRTNMDVINQTMKMLHSSFDMKDMGEAYVILGIIIQKNSNGYILTQSHYIEKTLKKFRHYDDRPVVTPFDPKKLSKQTVNTRSTMEVKFVALDKAAEEAEWLRNFLEVEYYGIFLIGITYTRLMCGRIFGNQMAKFSKILINKNMFKTEMNTAMNDVKPVVKRVEELQIIVHEMEVEGMAPYTPQQNGVAERKNRTLKNMINSVLITLGAPHSLWGEACLAANTRLSKIPHKKSDKSPYQLWKGKQPSYKRMKVEQISNPRKRVMNDQLSQDETDNNFEVPQENVEPKRKFVALDKAAKAAEWLRSFLEGIPLWPKPVTAVCIHCDSMADLTRAKNHIFNGKSRHVRRRHNTIKDLLRNRIISIDYVKSKENIVDPLTKGLCREQVIFTSRGMGLKPTQ